MAATVAARLLMWTTAWIHAGRSMRLNAAKASILDWLTKLWMYGDALWSCEHIASMTISNVCVTEAQLFHVWKLSYSSWSESFALSDSHGKKMKFLCGMDINLRSGLPHSRIVRGHNEGSNSSVNCETWPLIVKLSWALFEVTCISFPTPTSL